MWQVSASVGDGVANLTRRRLAGEVRTAAERSTTNSSCPKYRCPNLRLRRECRGTHRRQIWGRGRRLLD